MREVVYHPKVPAEARDALAYYAEISSKLGDEFWEELTAAIEYARQWMDFLFIAWWLSPSLPSHGRSPFRSWPRIVLCIGSSFFCSSMFIL